MKEPCELLMVHYSDFDRLLYERATENFNSRLEVLELCDRFICLFVTVIQVLWLVHWIAKGARTCQISSDVLPTSLRPRCSDFRAGTGATVFVYSDERNLQGSNVMQCRIAGYICRS